MNITISFPPLPAGYAAIPDQFLAWISENATFEADGDALSGQIGGDRPTEDSGIWFGDDSIEKFKDGEYRTITDVPVGCILFSAAGPTIPENYLACEGQSVSREEYPLLFEAIGTTWGTESPTTFTLPDTRGRVAIGSDGVASNTGPGTYSHQGFEARLDSRSVGTYYGFSWPRNIGTWEGAPTAAQGARRHNSPLNATSGKIGSVEPPSLCLRGIIRYR